MIGKLFELVAVLCKAAVKIALGLIVVWLIITAIVVGMS